MSTVKTGWLHNQAGDRFAPKTLISQVQTSDGTLLADKIQADIDAAKEEILDATSVNVDAELSNNSENPVQNKVVKAELDTLTQKTAEIEAAVDEWATADIENTYETKADATVKLGEAKSYTDTQTDGAAYINAADNESIEVEIAGNYINIDTVLSETSANPVQNKVVTAKLNQLTEDVAGNTEELSKVSAAIGDFSNRVNNDYYREHVDYIPVTLTPLVGDMQYCYWSNTSNNKVEKKSSDAISYNGHVEIPVIGGEEYKISNLRTGSENYLRAWFVIDDEYNVIVSADKGTDSSYHDFDIVIPDGGKYLCINEHNVFKATMHKKTVVYTPVIETETVRTRNLFDSDIFLGAEECTKSEDGVYSVIARNLSALGVLSTNFENGVYTLSLKAKTDANIGTDGNGVGFKFMYDDGKNSTYYMPNTTAGWTDFVFSSDGRNVIELRVTASSKVDNVWHIKDIQLEKNAVNTEYVPFVLEGAKDEVARQNIKNSLKSGNIVIYDTSEYTSFDELPLNTVVNIKSGVRLANRPDGYIYVGHNATDTGTYDATVLTYSSSNIGNCSIVQVCTYYNDTYEFSKQPRTAVRYGIKKSDGFVWSEWSTMSNDGFLRSTNRVVDVNSYDEFTFGDFNDAPANTIYQVDLNCADVVLNNPSPGHSGLLITYAFSPISRHALVQNHYALERGELAMYIRYSYKADVDDFRWTPWRRMTTDSTTDPTIDLSGYMKNMGRLPDGSDLNSIKGNCIYLVGDNAGNQNVPTESAGFITIKTVGSITLQTFESLNGSRYTRNAVGDTWGEWFEN